MKAKVIKIDATNNEVTLGFQGGNMTTVPYGDLGFDVKLDDELEIFSDNNGKFAFSNLTPHKHVNKIIYILLAFFLGGAGAHKFYAGKKTQGIIYLCFFWTWIPEIISFIEAITTIFNKADSNGNILV